MRDDPSHIVTDETTPDDPSNRIVGIDRLFPAAAERKFGRRMGNDDFRRRFDLVRRYEFGRIGIGRNSCRSHFP